MKKLKRPIITILIFVIITSCFSLVQINQGFALDLLTPKNFSVQVNHNYNKLSWENNNKNPELISIIIERSIDQGEFHQIADLGGKRISYNDNFVYNGHVYTYRAYTKYKENKSPYTPEVEAVNLFPENFKVVNAFEDHVNLEWSYPTLPINKEPSYDVFIERRGTIKSSWKDIAKLSANETMFRDDTVDPDSPYYYRLRISYHDKRHSKYLPTSTGKYTRTAYPLNTTLWGYALSKDSIRIMWEMPDSPYANVWMERKNSLGDFIPLYVLKKSSFTDRGLLEGNTYTYRLRMETSKTGSKSQFTDEINIKVEEVSSPIEFSASAIASDKIVLSWSYAHDNETEFEIWRKGDGPWELLSTVPRNTYNFVDASSTYGQTYIYRVRAKRGANSFSNFSLSSTVINDYPKNPGPLYCYTSGNLLYIFSNEKPPKNTTYTLEFRTNINSPWHEIRSVEDDILMTNLGFSASTEYHLRIRSSIGNLSSTSPELHFFGSVPEKPLNLEAPVVGYNRVTLKWPDGTEKESGYEIYRSIKGVKKMIGKVDKDTDNFIDQFPVMGENTYYEVIAYNLIGVSPATGISVKIPKKVIYRDIDSYKWAHDAIYTLQGMGALGNIQNDSFYPQNVITIGQMAQMVLKSFNISYSSSTLLPPSDIIPNHIYYKDIVTAINLGLMHPDSNGRIYPNRAATRKDIILILSSALGELGYPLNPHGTEYIEKYNDFWQIPKEDINIVASFAGDSIISGKSGQILDLNSNTTRIEAVAFIYRTLLKYKIVR